MYCFDGKDQSKIIKFLSLFRESIELEYWKTLRQLALMDSSPAALLRRRHEEELSETDSFSTESTLFATRDKTLEKDRRKRIKVR